MSTSSSSRDSSGSTGHSRQRKPPNVVLLRRALRLVHCLQKERGASGAYCAALAAASSLTPASASTQLPELGRDGDSFHAAAALATQQNLRVGTLDAMESARQNTDSAIFLFNSMALDPATQQPQQQNRRYREPLPIPVSATLQKVRALLPTATKCGGIHNSIMLTQLSSSSSPSSDRVGFHRILVCFNTLIATVIHECILRHTSVSKQCLYPPRRGGGNAPLSGSNSFSSFSVLQMQQQQQPQQHSQQQQYRASSIGLMPGSISTSHLIPPRIMPTPVAVTSSSKLRALRSDRPVHPSSDPSRMEYFFHEVESAPETLVPISGGECKQQPQQEDFWTTSSTNNTSSSARSLLQSQSQPTNDTNNSEQQTQHNNNNNNNNNNSPWMELLQLLDCFTRLKESTGMERAMLCSILAAGQVDSVWLNDLIVQVENQRKLVDELNELCGIIVPQQQPMTATPPPQLQPSSVMNSSHHPVQPPQINRHLQSLQHLVQDVVHMNPNLQALQNKILTDCNLEGLNYQQPNGLWDLLSTYIDKLHSLELLILEEMEYCLPKETASVVVVAASTATPPTTASTTSSPLAASQMSSQAASVDEKFISKPVLNGDQRQQVEAANSGVPSLEAASTTTTVTDVETPQTQTHSNNNNFQILEQLFFGNSPLAADAMHHIQAMSSDQVKAKLLEILDCNKKGQTAQTPATDSLPQYQPESHENDDTLHKHPPDNNHQQQQQQQNDKRSAPPNQKREIQHHDSILDPLDPWNTAASTITSKEWEINLYEITFQKRIGRGASGTTYQAKWSGQRVAVKVASVTEMGLDGWRTEVKALQKLHHPNIIRLLGSVCNPSPLTYCLVLEYCSAGDLAWALQQSTPRQFFSTIASGMAHGMAYLHSRDIIHRDIKPSNVLLDGDLASGHFVVKVSDFGVATTQAYNREDHTAETGTYRWMAPEVIRHEAYSHMADVYSYALVLWQLLTRENPFANVSPISAAGKVALEGARPPFPLGTPRAVQDFIQTCWQEVPEQRLPFDRISEILASELQAMLTPEEMVWLESSHGHAVYARGVPTTTKVHRPAEQPLPSLQPPVAAVPATVPPVAKGGDYLAHHVNPNPPQQQQQHSHREQHQNHDQQQPQQAADKRGSFRRIFPKLARN